MITSKERKAELIRVLNDNPPTGPLGVNWDSVWRANPGLKEKLGAHTRAGRNRMSVVVAGLRSMRLVPKATRGIVKATMTPAQVRERNNKYARDRRLRLAQAQNGNGNGHGSPLEVKRESLLEKEKRIYTLILGYRDDGGRVNFKGAMREHPEWAAELGATGKIKLRRLQSRFCYWAANHGPQAQPPLVPVPAAQPAPVQAPSCEIPEVHQCPRCKLAYFDAPDDPQFAALFHNALETAIRIASKHYRK